MAIAILLGGVIWFINQDSLPKAANRFAQAFVRNDPDTVWNFVGAKEKKAYGMERQIYDKFWKEFMDPLLPGKTQVKVEPFEKNLLEVTITSPNEKGGLSYEVTGRPGEYYSPAFFLHSFMMLAVQDFEAGDLKTAGPRYHLHLAHWFRKNKARIEACGMTGLRFGTEPELRSLDRVITSFENSGLAQNGGKPL